MPMIEPNAPLLVALLALAYFVRWLAAKDATTGFDTYFYLLSSREVHRQGVGISGSLKLPLIPEQSLAVPYLCQWCAGLLPEDILRNHHGKIGLIADSLFALTVYGVTISAGFNAGTALAVFLLYLFTPAMFSRVAIGPRVSNFTPRLFSEIFGNLFFMVVFLPLPISPMWQLMVSSVLAALIILTSKFGLQVMLFVVPLASMFAGDGTGVLAFLIGIVLAVAVTRGQCGGAMREQVRHLSRYAVRNFRKEMPISNRNSLSKLREYLGAKKAVESRAGKVLFYLLSANSYTGVILKFTAVPVLFAVLGYCWTNGISTGLESAIMAPVYAATAVFLLINLPPLLFLGEAERYINHVAYFVFLSLVLLLNRLELTWIVPALLLIGFVYWIMEVALLPRMERGVRGNDDASRRVLSYFNANPRPRRVALFPYHAIGVWRIGFETGNAVVYPISLGADQLKSFERFAGTYPHVNLAELEGMWETYGVDTLVIQKSAPVPPGFTPPAAWRSIDAGEPVYSVYERRGESRSPATAEGG